MGKAAATEEQRRIRREFIRSNFMLNLQRLQIAFIVFWCVGFTYLILFYFTALFEPAFPEPRPFKIPAVIVLALFTLAVFYIAYLRRNTGRIKQITIHRFVLDAYIVMALVSSAVFFFAYKYAEININCYIMVVLAVAAVPFLERLEMGAIYLVAHGVFVALVLTSTAFGTSREMWMTVANSSVFVGFAYLVSLFTRNLRWSDFQKERRIREQNMELAHMANTDYLTNLYNKRYAYAALRMEWNRSLRSEKPLSLIILDIDSFKDYNDAYGHIQGDQCLKEVADVVRRSARRKTDQVCRFGGEELLVILPYTSGVDAYAIGEKIRKDVAEAAIPHQNSVVAPVVTVSAGVASMVADRSTDFETLLERTDRALYRAKHNGRNMVVM